MVLTLSDNVLFYFVLIRTTIRQYHCFIRYSLYNPDAVSTVNWAPDDGHGICPKHVERLTGNNKVLYSVTLLEFLKLIHDARNDKHKMYYLFILSPSILGISQAWVLLRLAVAHSGDSNIKVEWSNELMSCCDIFLSKILLVNFMTGRTRRTSLHLTFVLQCTVVSDPPVTDG
jgi:hypothetical protein